MRVTRDSLGSFQAETSQIRTNSQSTYRRAKKRSTQQWAQHMVGPRLIQAKESSGKRSHQGKHHTAGGQREGKVKFSEGDPPEQN